MKKVKIFDPVVYSIVAFFMLLFFASTLSASNYKDPFVVITFAIIGIFGFCMFVFDKRYLSINKLTGIFVLLFCCLAPFYQYCSNYNVWNLTDFSNDDYLVANMLILLFLFVYQTSYFYFKKNLKNRSIERKNNKNFQLTSSTLSVFLFVSFFCLLYLIWSGNLVDFGGNETTKSSLEIFTLKIFYYFPVASLLYFFFCKENGNIVASKFSQNVFIFLTLLVTLIIFFPFNGSIARYLLLGTYISLFYMFSKNRFKHSSLILLGFAVGFYYIFPALNFFKYHSITELNKFTFGGFDFNSHDYDAYQVFMMTIKYTKNNGFLFGNNFLSSLFCLIPRSIWTSKLEQTGSIVSSYFGASFTNLSCPYFAECYASFGVLGIIILTPILTLFISKIEAMEKSGSVLGHCFQASFLGLAIYYLRGSLLPATSFLFGIMLSSVVAYGIAHIFYKSVKKRGESTYGESRCNRTII